MASCFVSVMVARATPDRLRLSSFADNQYQQSRGVNASNVICREQVEKLVDRVSISTGQVTGPVPGSTGGPTYRGSGVPNAGSNAGPAASDTITSYDHAKDNIIYFVSCKPASTQLIIVLAVNKASPALSGAVPNQIQAVSVPVLEEIEKEFLSQFPVSVIKSASKPFQMIKFETHLAKVLQRNHFNVNMKQSKAGGWAHLPAAATDATTGGGAAGPSAYDELHQELKQVHAVIKSNLDDILTRGEKIDNLSQNSAALKASSKTYYGKTVQLNRMRWLKTYGPPAVIVTFIAAYLWFFWL